MSAVAGSIARKRASKKRDRLECRRRANVAELLRNNLVRNDSVELRGFDLSCPHCGYQVHLKVLHIRKSPKAIDNYRYFALCQCPRRYCSDVIFVEFDTVNDRIIASFPYPSTRASNFPESIPLRVREDMAEAVRAFAADCLKSVVVMCRRAFQNVARDKKIEKGEIKAQIAAMQTAGLITKPLADAAQEIRHFAGFGAHPQDDQLDETTRDDALSVWRLLQQFVNHIYVMTAETAALAKRRQGIHQKPKP
jgi:hypothetical protein